LERSIGKSTLLTLAARFASLLRVAGIGGSINWIEVYASKFE
jgi:hypothetical protein